MRPHAWERVDRPLTGSGLRWVCRRCGADVASGSEPRASGSDSLVTSRPFQDHYEERSVWADCDLELVKKVMES